MKRFLVILNPKSGQGSGQDALSVLKSEAEKHDVELEVLTTEGEGDACEFARTHGLEDYDAVISIGGDGTLNEVVNGLLRREDEVKVPLGILPMGTGNSLMKDLGCETADDAIQDLFSGKRFSMDAFEADVDGEPRYGCNMVGCGLPSAVNHYAEASRAFKSQRYNVGVIKALCRYTSVGYEFTANDSDKTWTSDFILVSNTQHIGSGIRIAPDAELNDGEMDAVVLGDLPKRSLISLFFKLRKGRHMQDSNVESMRLSSFSIQAPSPQEINIDGEQVPFTEVSVKVLPQRLQLMHEPAYRGETS